MSSHLMVLVSVYEPMIYASSQSSFHSLPFLRESSILLAYGMAGFSHYYFGAVFVTIQKKTAAFDGSVKQIKIEQWYA